ncbi:hypothetical protein B6S44_17470 [Bosea sp. Tri-44]|uniref:transglutaminase-like domain-containing protein n=1 Tax=Bosea sp. Tri-44 TaxID=1972137 RepID=UPI00100EEE3C|nr:transglutaminase domain-containing protein [Bosea sp. Tri-44]RXT52558.1 hypothetical protein B6S44_17470 [Bosea sp. Tri-44]
MTTGSPSLSERIHLTLDVVYAFDRPAYHLDLELRARPLLAAEPRLAPIRLACEPEARFEPTELDGNGVAVDRLKLAGPVSRLRLNASFDRPIGLDEPLPALVPTASDLAVEGLPFAASAMPWQQALANLRESWRYSDAPLHQSPSLQEIAQRRTGSCEAMTRLAVEMVRTQGVPARFIGGYRLAGPPGDTRPVRRHAWIAVWDGMQWRPFDPLATSGAANMVVATAFGGRLQDIAVVQGRFKGAGQARLIVSAHAQRHIVQAHASQEAGSVVARSCP